MSDCLTNDLIVQLNELNPLPEDNMDRNGNQDAIKLATKCKSSLIPAFLSFALPRRRKWREIILFKKTFEVKNG